MRGEKIWLPVSRALCCPFLVRRELQCELHQFSTINLIMMKVERSSGFCFQLQNVSVLLPDLSSCISVVNQDFPGLITDNDVFLVASVVQDDRPRQQETCL